MAKFRIKGKWKTMFSVVAAVLAVAFLGGLVVGLVGNDRKTISPGEFKVGELDAKGEFVESETSLYTKDAFSCEGLRIEPAFESKLTYDVYYYDVKGDFLDSKTGLTDVFEEDYPMADKARVVIHPEKPDDVKASEWAIRFWEVRGYANDIKITVNEKQLDYETSPNLYVAGETGTFDVEDITKVVTNAAMKNSTVIDLTSRNYTYYRVYVKNASVGSASAIVAFAEADGVAISYNEKGKVVEGELAHVFNADEMLVDTWYSVLVEVPTDATMLRVAAASDAEVRIYGVNEK